MKVTIYNPPGFQSEILRDNTMKVLVELGVEAHVEVESDEFSFAKAGVMFTPAVSIDGTLISNGWIPEAADVAQAVHGKRY